MCGEPSHLVSEVKWSVVVKEKHRGVFILQAGSASKLLQLFGRINILAALGFMAACFFKVRVKERGSRKMDTTFLCNYLQKKSHTFITFATFHYSETNRPSQQLRGRDYTKAWIPDHWLHKSTCHSTLRQGDDIYMYISLCVCVCVSHSVVFDSLGPQGPGSSVYGVLQARILNCIALSSATSCEELTH